MDVTTKTANELIGLSDRLLCRYGMDIDAVRCVAMSEFFISAYAVQPDLTVYSISQLDNKQNLFQLFAATRHKDLGTTDLQLYRDGPWEGTFRKIGTKILALPFQRLQ
jgi:hypothetical protein